MSAARIRWNCS